MKRKIECLKAWKQQLEYERKKKSIVIRSYK